MPVGNLVDGELLLTSQQWNLALAVINKYYDAIDWDCKTMKKWYTDLMNELITPSIGGIEIA